MSYYLYNLELIGDILIITKKIAHVKKGCGHLQYPLFDELKRGYASQPEKLDSLTREEFENVISCKKEEKNNGNYFGVIYHGSNGGTLYF